FNTAATLFRLGRYEEAAVYYQRSLDDQLIPPVRAARANYDLGTALLRAYVQDRRRLEQAIAALRRALELTDDADLRADARHNLELAKWLWLQAKPAASSQTNGDAPPSATGNQPERQPTDRGDPRREPGTEEQAHSEGEKVGTVDNPDASAQRKALAHGPLQVLDDSEEPRSLTPEETAAHLERVVARIRSTRREAWQATPPLPHVRDW
ncbi:MAG: hypothetical protein NZO58_05310, partial [Gemmataceae bacterium]|nr:hypothetical protein [Gemmataceae bacterium]